MASDPDRKAESERPGEIERATEKAIAAAMRSLGRHERSVAEMRTWLTGRELPAEAVERAVEHLLEIGALDDRRFALAFAEDKRTIAGWGSQRIEGALRARGLSEEAIAEALEGDGGDTELERAVTLLVERAEPLDGDAARQRAFGFLARRGYPPELAYEAIRACARGGAHAFLQGR